MKISGVRLAVILSVLLTCGTVAHAEPFTFSLLPETGAISGAPGSTIGWGYTIANPSATNWLWLTTVSADLFLHATADASVFLFPILAPGSSMTVPYSSDTFEGLFQMTWDADAPVGFTNSGLFVLGGEFWSGDPLAVGSFVDFADDQSAAYSATVTGTVSSVPEPGTLLLAGAGALSLLGIRRRRAIRRDGARNRVAFLLLVITPVLIYAQGPTAKPAPQAATKFKAIWEPVSVKEDLALASVHFVSQDEGWVAGGTSSVSGGVIVHTSDGGMTWDTQLGDPTSDDRGYDHLRFLDAKTGFAVQSTDSGDHRLFRTTDGRTWSPIGVVAQHRTDYRFVSPTVGFVSEGNNILRTADGGKKWASVYVCRVKAEVDGLTRDMPCQISALHFADARNGFGVTRDLGSGAGVAFVKTSDGGAAWSASVILPGENGHEAAVHFVDSNNGVVRMQNGRVYRTSDGGQTWSGALGEIDGRPAFSFADAQIGWAAKYQKVLYTRDGGQSWLSSTTKFPAPIEDSSLPTRDRGYVVGEHGMVYRYRIVPADYQAKGMLPAPSIAGAAK